MRVSTQPTPAVADESAHPDSAMEWWFVQGYYEGARSGRRHLMASLFRQRVPDDAGGPGHAFSLLLSVLDPATGCTTCLSQVDPAVVDLFVRLGGKMRSADLPCWAVDAAVAEVASYGPPRPVRREEAPVELGSHPFRAAWADFGLSCSADGFDLAFVEPEGGRRCSLHLRPLRPRVHIEGIEVLDAETMDYVSYPSLELIGTVAGEEVEGRAWLDHQWGNLGWFVARGSMVLGWDWLGVSLDDGTDLLVMVHRDMRDRRPVGQYAVVLADGSPARLCSEVVVEPLRHWESPATHVRYPVACRLRIPEVQADLTFEPLADDQEIPVLGVMRALWEGAGTATGTLGGRQVAGRARLELHGYGYLRDIRGSLEQWAERVDLRIAEFFPKVLDEAQVERYAGAPTWRHDPSAQTEVLSEPVWDLIERGGKHWRPVFGILMLEALGVASEPYELLVAMTTEFAHTGALVIDDIEDHAHTRRGDECIHVRYGVEVAINAANMAYFLPYLLLRDYPHLTDAQRLEMYGILSSQSVRSHLGQGQDIYWSRSLTVERLCEWMDNSLAAKILQAYAHKTASLVQGVAEAACVIARADEPTRRACTGVARAFGVGFQIVDDVLDFDEQRLRDGSGGRDLSEGKVTYVLLRSLESLGPRERARLAAVLCSPDLRGRAEALRECVGLVRGSGVLDACRGEARAMFDDAWRRLSECLPPSEPKTMLRALCTTLLGIGDGGSH